MLNVYSYFVDTDIFTLIDSPDDSLSPWARDRLSYNNVHEENKLQDYTRKRGGLQFFFHV